MGIDKLKDAAEFVALVAVVGSLVTVVIELRQTQAALQAQTYQDRAFDSIAFNFHLAELDEDGTLFSSFAGEWSAGDLSPSELVKARRILRSMMIDLDNEHFQHQNGFVDDDFYAETSLRQIRRFAPIWRKLGLREPRAVFRDEVDRLLGLRVRGGLE